jgi:two-component SAPR family response regulator
VTQRDFSGDFTKLDLIQKIKAIKEILRDLHLNLLGVDLVEIDGMELALKINLKKPYEEFALKGFLAFLQDYLRKYFNKEDLNLRIEKNL